MIYSTHRPAVVSGHLRGPWAVCHVRYGGSTDRLRIDIFHSQNNCCCVPTLSRCLKREARGGMSLCVRCEDLLYLVYCSTKVREDNWYKYTWYLVYPVMLYLQALPFVEACCRDALASTPHSISLSLIFISLLVHHSFCCCYDVLRLLLCMAPRTW